LFPPNASAVAHARCPTATAPTSDSSTSMRSSSCRRSAIATTGDAAVSVTNAPGSAVRRRITPAVGARSTV
jgi:hypothetical protein